MPYSNNARIELRGMSKSLEARLVPITAEMNEHRLRVNRATWLRNLTEAENEMMNKVEICRLLTNDPEFRPNSPADCEKALFTNRGIKPTVLSKSKRPTMDKDTLAEMANQGDKLAEAVLQARETISRHSQLRAWQEYADKGWVAPVWDSMGQPQGRYTSDGPCLNNRIVPIRETIEPDEGWSFLSLDLGQAEYVTWASLSKDEVLGAAFKEHLDFHTEMANGIREFVPDWNLRGEEARAAGKTINFAILYQMKAWSLARKLGCSGEVAEKIIKAYYARANKAELYLRSVLAAAKKNGFVETLFGRRRYCPEYAVESDRFKMHELEKTIWHMHNAGTAAEILKFKQLETWEALRAKGYSVNEVRLALNMYDEIILVVSDKVLSEVRVIAKRDFGKPIQGFLDFPVTVKVGKNWKEISK